MEKIYEEVAKSNDSSKIFEFMDKLNDEEKGRFIKYLIDGNYIDPSELDNLLIKAFSSAGNLEMVRVLLSDSRVDPSSNDYYAIKEASKNGHIEVVKLLLLDFRVNKYMVSLRKKNYSLKQVKNIETRAKIRAVEEKMRKQILREEMNRFKAELTVRYFLISKAFPQIICNGKEIPKIPRDVIREIVYGSFYREYAKSPFHTSVLNYILINASDV